MVCLLRPVSQPDAFDMEEEDFKAKNGGAAAKNPEVGGMKAIIKPYLWG